MTNLTLEHCGRQQRKWKTIRENFTVELPGVQEYAEPELQIQKRLASAAPFLGFFGLKRAHFIGCSDLGPDVITALP